jgi:arsenate reductase (glutaredoxin)
MKATIWHNPACGTSRKTLALLEAQCSEVEVIEYLKEPPSREKLAQLFRAAGIAPAQGLRLRGTEAEDAMMDDPRLIERPLVETAKGVRLCRPPERALEIL